jgi:hypothetical protein
MCHFVNRVLEKLSTFLVLRSAFISRQVKDDAIWRRLSLGVAYQRGEICRSRLLWSAITKPSHPHENVSSAHADALQRRYNGSHDPFPDRHFPGTSSSPKQHIGSKVIPTSILPEEDSRTALLSDHTYLVSQP